MRLAAGAIANAAAWLVILVLVVAAALVANRLGFAGLFILGVATWLVCTHASLDESVPSAGVAVFRASMERPHSPEEKAAAQADRQANLSPFRFYGWCGLALAAIGAGGFAWQMWAG